MGLGLILLCVLAVAAFLLAKKLGWLNSVLTLGHGVRSRFSRVSADGQTIFKVTPARASRAALAAIILGVWILGFTSLGILTIVGVIPLVMGLLAFSIGARYRQPRTIGISAQGMRSGEVHWPLADIIDLEVRRGTWINADEPAQVIHRTPDGGLEYASKSTSAMLSRLLNRRAIERSYLVALRTRSGGGDAVLSGGLTRECAEALRNDLHKEISSKRNA